MKLIPFALVIAALLTSCGYEEGQKAEREQQRLDLLKAGIVQEMVICPICHATHAHWTRKP